MFFSVVAEMLVAERVVDDARRERSGTNLKKVAILTWKEQMLCACSIYYYYSKKHIPTFASHVFLERFYHILVSLNKLFYWLGIFPTNPNDCVSLVASKLAFAKVAPR